MKFQWLVSHFWRRYSNATYSLKKRSWNKFTPLCTDFNFDLYSCSDVSNIPVEWLSNVLLKNIFVVKPSKSSGLSLQGNSGLLLRMDSISQSIVISDSSWYVLSFVPVFMTVIDNSHDPPILGLTAGLNSQTIPQCDISVWIFDWLRSWSILRSSW